MIFNKHPTIFNTLWLFNIATEAMARLWMIYILKMVVFPIAYSYLKLPERNKLCRPCGGSSGRQRPETCQYMSHV